MSNYPAWTYSKNTQGIKDGDVVHRDFRGENDSGFFLVDTVETDTPGNGSNGVRTTVKCRKIAYNNGTECRGQVLRSYDVDGLKVVNKKYIDDIFDKAVADAEVRRATMTGILEDIDALKA